MDEEDWIKYCEEKKKALEYAVKRLKREIMQLEDEIEFFERQIEKGRRSD
ncbi:MAG: hypothetical protein ACTSPB_03525 [Candidatus Thorarchaeota archaeon]